MKEGFVPDSISTDLHIGSMNAGMKDMLNVMDKFLAMGMSLDDVVARSTWNPAREIKQDDLGHLSVGAVADVAVLRVEKRAFRAGGHERRAHGLDRAADVRADGRGRQGRLRPERDSRPDWRTLPKDYGPIGDGRWDGLNPARGTTPGTQRGRGATARCDTNQEVDDARSRIGDRS